MLVSVKDSRNRVLYREQVDRYSYPTQEVWEHIERWIARNCEEPMPGGSVTLKVTISERSR